MGDVILALILGGLMGLVGQGTRAIVGMKKLNDRARAEGVSLSELFDVVRFTTSLMIGFITGVIGALSIGLSKIAQASLGDTDVLLAIATIGYAGSDAVEAFAARLSGTGLPATKTTAPTARQSQGTRLADTSTATPVKDSGPTLLSAGDRGARLGDRDEPLAEAKATRTSLPGRRRDTDLASGAAVSNPKYGVVFGSLVEGGFFSSDPDDLRIHRSIRSNNPGALNFAEWQTKKPGYVGKTLPDNSPDHNVTTIFRTPEHGVALWYHLLQNYNLGASFTLTDLARHYAGGNAPPSAIAAYVKGWTRWAYGGFDGTTELGIGDVGQMTSLGKAMFSHEAAQTTPLLDDQIVYGIVHAEAMPA